MVLLHSVLGVLGYVEALSSLRTRLIFKLWIDKEPECSIYYTTAEALHHGNRPDHRVQQEVFCMTLINTLWKIKSETI